ncbi:intein-containing Rv2578c family radical SAM protein [Dactylosporangium sp. NPDC049742]|uniref:intein-containing Rv2578c family radical SAM protein n=1 Tax=Dactylosporangium sp. NPDC049742 TaxID=3154737 RepID=UPI003433856C
MRWDNLKATGGPGTGDAGPVRALPLALPGAVARTFDTPEFRGVTFYEVQAKSLINRVPGQSRVPFEWTINPYRGCSHACVYCLAGDTAILMADGTTRPLADLRPGDDIIGTVRDGRLRRYVTTKVLAHWSTVKPAHRVTLHDGTTLVASGDHRFLSDRGWKHVTGARHGRARRPHLTTANRLTGFGALPERPRVTPGYRRGYLCGFVHGDGHVGPVAPAALRRARAYATACGGLHAMAADDREFAGASVRDTSAVIDWPEIPTRAWRQGFVAGLFDAAGDMSGELPAFDLVDKVVVDWLVECLTVLGFATVTDGTLTRVLGGVRERLRFGLMFAPATPTGTVAGELVRGDESLRVTAIEPLGVDVPMFDITTGTGDFIAGGVVSHNCFARNTHTYLDLDAGHDFDSQIVVKVNAGEVLRRELSAPSWTPRHLAMGSNVDCYQRAEGRYQLMRDILAALRDHANPFSILTKGTLIARDLDLLTQAAQVTTVGVSMSIGFVDEPLWRSVEPGTPSPRRRLDVVRRLADAGFAVGVLMAPILPGLTDAAESIDTTVAALAAAGAASVVPLTLHLRPGAREWYQAWLTREHPHLAPRYRQLYGDGAYAGQAYQREVAARVRLACRRHGLSTGDTSTTRQLSAAPPPLTADTLPLPFPPTTTDPPARSTTPQPTTTRDPAPPLTHTSTGPPSSRSASKPATTTEPLPLPISPTATRAPVGIATRQPAATGDPAPPNRPTDTPPQPTAPTTNGAPASRSTDGPATTTTPLPLPIGPASAETPARSATPQPAATTDPAPPNRPTGRPATTTPLPLLIGPTSTGSQAGSATPQPAVVGDPAPPPPLTRASTGPPAGSATSQSTTTGSPAPPLNHTSAGPASSRSAREPATITEPLPLAIGPTSAEAPARSAARQPAAMGNPASPNRSTGGPATTTTPLPLPIGPTSTGTPARSATPQLTTTGDPAPPGSRSAREAATTAEPLPLPVSPTPTRTPAAPVVGGGRAGVVEVGEQLSLL